MCTRFFIKEDSPEFTHIFDKAMNSVLVERIITAKARPVKTSGEIRPTDIVPVVASNRRGERSAFPMIWGFTLPNSNNPIVNARAETASKKPMFMEAWRSRRCVIPASWYYEWEHLKSPEGKIKTGSKYIIQPCNSTVIWLCGLYRFENDLPVFTVLTREPSAELSSIHDRMPLILPEDKIDEWIRPDSDPNALLSFALTDMIIEKSE